MRNIGDAFEYISINHPSFIGCLHDNYDTPEVKLLRLSQLHEIDWRNYTNEMLVFIQVHSLPLLIFLIHNMVL